MKEIIKKSIEGGWLKEKINGEKIHDIVVKNRITHFSTLFKINRILWTHTITLQYKDSEYNFPLADAIFGKEFWQGLSVACKWQPKRIFTSPCFDDSSLVPEYVVHATRFQEITIRDSFPDAVKWLTDLVNDNS